MCVVISTFVATKDLRLSAIILHDLNGTVVSESFGHSVAMNRGGTRVVVGSPDYGSDSGDYYAAGAVMALGSLWRNISFGAARVLAFLTVAAMFFYFAAFFRIVDHFHENWCLDDLFVYFQLASL